MSSANENTEKIIPVLGIILGDHAGSSPEMVAKVILAKDEDYVPVLVGNKERFLVSRSAVKGAEMIKILDWAGEARPAPCEEGTVYFYDIPAGSDIQFGKTTRDSGKLMYDSIKRAIELERAELLDGLLMAPITKAGLHAAGYDFPSELELFANLYDVDSVASVLKCGDYFRSTVVGHCAFREIADRVTKDGIKSAARRLISIMRYFLPEDEISIAVAALNPHAGENGLFGNEEITVITPAIEDLRREDKVNAAGPWPADTALLKIKNGLAKGIVYLYHDQGNIAMKSSAFGEIVLIYVNFPGTIVSVGHGPAMGKAGKGTADPKNLIASMKVLREIATNKLAAKRKKS